MNLQLVYKHGLNKNTKITKNIVVFMFNYNDDIKWATYKWKKNPFIVVENVK